MTVPFEYRLALPWSVRIAALHPDPVPAPQRVNGIVVDHYDADTIYVELDLQLFGLFARKQSIRVLGMAARELREPGGKEARDALKARPGMTAGSPVVLTMVGYDKYGGRLDAVVTFRDEFGVSRDLASALIADHWAVPWNGIGSQPKPPWPRPEDITP